MVVMSHARAQPAFPASSAAAASRAVPIPCRRVKASRATTSSSSVLDAHEGVTDLRSSALGEEALELRRVLGQALAAHDANLSELR